MRRISRRKFVSGVSLGIAGGTIMGGCTSFEYDKTVANDFYFVTPFDGGIYHEKSGTPVQGVINDINNNKLVKMEVTGVVPKGILPIIDTGDGITYPVEIKDGTFTTTVLLKNRVTEITARAVINGKMRSIRTRPVLVHNSFLRFRCYIDDHSFFFREITQKRYKSIFDCFYLARLRDLHRNYGAKINLNCFNTTPERDFELSMFPDTYKSEFEDNAHWMRLAFHSENEFPDKPYLNATAKQFAADFDLVARQLRRIAGKAYTTGLQIHWADVPPECYKVLADRGVKMLATRARRPDDKKPKICDFHLPDSVLSFLCDHQGWMDFESGLIFYSGSAGGRDWVTVDKIVERMRERLDNPACNHLINIAGHEQYWFPFYRNYRPDMYERYALSFEHVLERGYQPIWIEDGFFGGT